MLASTAGRVSTTPKAPGLRVDVPATDSARYDAVQPKKFSDPGPGCLDQNPVPGFKVDVGRHQAGR